MSYDPLSSYIYNQTGIPQAYLQAMEQLGFLGRPFGGAEQNFQAVQQYQGVMKSMLDRLVGGFQSGNGNFANMPFNVRNMFNSAAPILTDPMYAGLSNPNFFKNGYVVGAMPNDPSWAYGGWKEQTSGFPNFPPPAGISSFGQPSWYNQAGQQPLPSNAPNANNPLGPNGQPLTPQQQNPNTGSNSGPGGQYAAQRQQAADIGTHSATDSSGNSYTINKSYANMTPQEKDDANRFAHNMAG
jgi:hypothetical protein